MAKMRASHCVDITNLKLELTFNQSCCCFASSPINILLAGVDVTSEQYVHTAGTPFQIWDSYVTFIMLKILRRYFK